MGETVVRMEVRFGNAALLVKGEYELMVISKYMEVDGQQRYLVALVHPKMVMSDGRHFILWSKRFEERYPTNMQYGDAAYQKYFFLIGKMCKKVVGSKYFGKYDTLEHGINGNGGTLTDDELDLISGYAMEMYPLLKEGQNGQ